MNRDEMRSKLFAPVERKRKKVTVKGVEFELLQPLVKEREEFTKEARDGDSASLVAKAVIAMAVIPGTNERVFEDTDLEAFKNEVVGGVIDQVAEKIADFIRTDQDEKKD